MPDQDTTPRSGRAPWVVAGVAGVVFVVLLALYYAVLRPYGQNHTPGELSGTETTAVNAAAADVTNLLSYRRAHFTADFKRALGGVTGSMTTELQNERATTLKTITSGKFDLSAKVTHQAYAGPVAKGSGYVVLLTVNGYKSSEPAVPMQQNLQVTVKKVKGKWLVSDLSNIAIS